MLIQQTKAVIEKILVLIYHLHAAMFNCLLFFFRPPVSFLHLLSTPLTSFENLQELRKDVVPPLCVFVKAGPFEKFFPDPDGWLCLPRCLSFSLCDPYSVGKV